MERAREIIASAMLAALALTPQPIAAAAPADAPTMQRESTGRASTQPAIAGKASKALADLGPLTLPAARPVGDEAPPIDAVRLYAQAYGAWLDRDRAAAISLLQKAITLDGDSFEMLSLLGEIYLASGADFDDHSIDALERAAAIEPDHAALQTSLGRQYMAKGDAAAGLKHLRFALLTRDYAQDNAIAAVTDFFVGSALSSQGYDAAALEIFERLSDRLKSPGRSMQVNSQTQALIEHADDIDNEVIDLQMRLGRFAAALARLDEASAANPGNFDLRARRARVLILVSRPKDAVAIAQDAVKDFHADAPSVALLEEATQAAGAGSTVLVLSTLHGERPDDRDILYALVDALRSHHELEKASDLLRGAAQKHSDDFEILRRRFEIVMQQGDRPAAAKLLIDGTSAVPDLATPSAPLFMRLSWPMAGGRLSWKGLSEVPVAPQQQAAKCYWVSRLAATVHREDMARSWLDQAIGADKAIYPPAFRDAVDQLWDRPIDPGEKLRQTADLAARVSTQPGGGALARELLALGLYHQHKFKESAELLAAGKDKPAILAPDALLLRALALRSAGQDDAADSLLWKLISDDPGFEEAYVALFDSSLKRNLEAQADRVVSVWMAADKQSLGAARLQAIQYLRAGRVNAARQMLKRLFEQSPGDPQTIALLQIADDRAQQSDAFIATLKHQHDNDPGNESVSAALVEALLAEGQTELAVRVIDGARQAAARDADLLYSISGLYARAARQDESEATLQELIEVDPAHPGAMNDLGYSWADEGKNLPRAQELIAGAVAAEPENAAYLDSMGWVLYKRGQFAEAREYLDRALAHSGPNEPAGMDPGMLDHRGDILYRLGEKDAAGADWQKAADALGHPSTAPPGSGAQREKLLAKLKALKSGMAVDVSPVGQTLAGPATAPAAPR